MSPNVGKGFHGIVLSLLDFCNSLSHKRCHWCGCGHGIEASFIAVKPCIISIIPSSCLTGRPFKHRRRRRRKRKKRTIPKLKCVRCTAQLSRVGGNCRQVFLNICFQMTMSNYHPQGPPANQQEVKLIDNYHFHDNLHFVCDMFDPQLPRRKQRRRVAPSNLSLNGAVVFTSRWLKSWLERRSSCLCDQQKTGKSWLRSTSSFKEKMLIYRFTILMDAFEMIFENRVLWT